MVPQGYAALAALPRTPAGKADRNALAGIEYLRVRAEEPAATPVPPEAELIVGVWREILGVPDLTAHDNFFAMGGQSLSAVRSIARLRTVLGVPLELRAIFESPTAASLARSLRVADHGPVEAIQRTDAQVLSFGQERIWIFEQLGTDVPAYNLPVAVSFPDGPVNVGALETCLKEIARRHEVLRTSDVRIPVLELAEADLDTAVTAEVRRPFALEDGPLLRAALFRTEEREFLLLTIHHIACDGWSIDLLVRELGALYEGEPLPELPVQYADYAAWQRDLLRGPELDRKLGYWREQLAGVPALELPLDRPRPAVASHTGARELFRIPEPLTGRLRTACREHGVTLFMGLLAPLQVLLGRYAGQHDVAVGTLVGGRSRPEIEHLIGYFVNTVVLRTDLSGDPTWSELLARVREVALGAYANQDVPFERLVEELRPDRDLSRNPLFQVLFAMHETVPGALPEPFSRRDLEGRLGAARFDLAFDVTDLGDELEVSIEFATDLFERSTVERLGRHLVRVLEQLVADPAARLSALEILSAEELRSLTSGPSAAPAEPTTLVELWHRQVAATPDVVAIVAGARRLTFAEVDRRASGLAKVLRDRGVGPESTVGVCLDRSADLIIALLGVLIAGGAYVPLDPSYPADRLRYLIEDSGVRLAITSRELPGVERILIADCPPAQRPESPESAVTPANLAYVIYTSGSTGQPKGVAITHANITSFLAWNQRICQLTGQDRALLNHSVAFDNSVWEIFQCLTSGAELHLADTTSAYDPELFLWELEDREITTLNATPSQLRILLEAADDPAKALASVRLIFTGAEAVPHDVAQRILAAAAPDCQIFNEYGPTEATVTSAYCPITADLLDRHAHRPSVPFGQATDNARLYVLDDQLRPVVPGCRGLLYVGGPAVGRGYLNKPARTAAAYLPDPFAGVPGARMYATGDVVQLLPDGNLVFLGRDDHQVKLRGYRIELGEIESAARAHPLVSDCVVAVRREALAAYLVLEEPFDLGSELRDHLAAELPAYMVPQSYTVITEVPLTPNGKVNLGALPEPQVATARAGRQPATALEKLVSQAWRECLELDEEVGLDDNFFDVGGNSLAVTGVTRWLSAELDRKVSPILIFQHPTVAGLAEVLSDAA
jgi:amino acid adenylation domain-containing protein